MSISAVLLTLFRKTGRTFYCMIIGKYTNWFLYQMSILLQVLGFGIGGSKTIECPIATWGGNTRDFL